MCDFHLQSDALFIEPCDFEFNVISGHAFVNGLEVFEIKKPHYTMLLESSGYCHINVIGDILDVKRKVIFIDYHRQFVQLKHVLKNVDARIGIMNDSIALKIKNMCNHTDFFKLDYKSSTLLPKYIIGSVKNEKNRTWCSNDDTLKWYIHQNLCDVNLSEEITICLLPKPNRNDIQSHLNLVRILRLAHVINTCPLLHSYSSISSFKIDDTSIDIPNETEIKHKIILFDTNTIQVMDVLDLPKSCLPFGKKQLASTFYHNNPVQGHLYGLYVHNVLICVLKCVSYTSLITVALEVIYGEVPMKSKYINLMSEAVMIK